MIEALRKAKHAVELQIERFRRRGIYVAGDTELDPRRHIAEAADWLKRAQDAGTDRGVSYGARFGEPFLPSYPETTGYIIPTMLRLADYTGEDEYRTRAIEMGHWEADVQMECGAVMGGRLNNNPSPAIFNTGQVLIGWAELVEQVEDPRSLEAGRRAADWLAGIQEADGNWREGNSRFANPESTVYNVRAAWGLGKFGAAIGEEKFVAAATRNAEFALSRQHSNGWFAECCLTDATRPLLHTLAYTMRGLLEIGLLTGREEFVSAARRAADAVLQRVQPSGYLSARWDAEWNPVSWSSCLTGCAQISIVWSKLNRIAPDSRYDEAVRRVNRFLMGTHDIFSADPTIHGALAGSWPTHGPYGQFMVLNWATKFLIDALLEEEAENRG